MDRVELELPGRAMPDIIVLLNLLRPRRMPAPLEHILPVPICTTLVRCDFVNNIQFLFNFRPCSVRIAPQDRFVLPHRQQCLTALLERIHLYTRQSLQRVHLLPIACLVLLATLAA